MHRNCLIAISALALIGCATPLRIPVSQETTQSIQATRGFVLLDQEEIGADFEPARGGGAAAAASIPGIGLLIAVAAAAAESAVVSAINSERAEQAKAQAVPVREALVDYNFRAQFREVLTRELANVSWLKLNEIKLGSIAIEPGQLKATLKENAVLVLKTRYSLSPGLRDVRIWCSAELIPNDERLTAIATRARPSEQTASLYRNEFVYTQPLPIGYSDPDHAAHVWSQHGGKLVRSALDQGTAEVARMLAMDIVRAVDAAAGASTTPVPVEYDNVRGEVLSENAERAILRLENGSLRSVAKDVAHGVAGQVAAPPATSAAVAPAAPANRAAAAHASTVPPSTQSVYPKTITGVELRAHLAKYRKLDGRVASGSAGRERSFTLDLRSDGWYDGKTPSIGFAGQWRISHADSKLCLTHTTGHDHVINLSDCYVVQQTAERSFVLLGKGGFSVAYGDVTTSVGTTPAQTVQLATDNGAGSHAAPFPRPLTAEQTRLHFSRYRRIDGKLVRASVGEQHLTLLLNSNGWYDARLAGGNPNSGKWTISDTKLCLAQNRSSGSFVGVDLSDCYVVQQTGERGFMLASKSASIYYGEQPAQVGIVPNVALSVPNAVLEDIAEPVVVDVRDRGVSHAVFKAAAIRALTSRGWSLSNVEAERIDGSLTRDREYRVRVLFQPGTAVKIAFVEGYGTKGQNWLLNLKKDMEQEFVLAAYR